MSNPSPRSYPTIQADIQQLLRPMMSEEAVAMLARVMAFTIAQDTRQFTHLTEVFKSTFASEYGYLHRTRQSGGPDDFHRTRSGVA
jgi:hypothetical protein